jgi:hypothetical protein
MDSFLAYYIISMITQTSTRASENTSHGGWKHTGTTCRAPPGSHSASGAPGCTHLSCSGFQTVFSRKVIASLKPTAIRRGIKIFQHLNSERTHCHTIFIPSQATPWKQIAFLISQMLQHTAKVITLATPNFLLQSHSLATDSKSHLV